MAVAISSLAFLTIDVLFPCSHSPHYICIFLLAYLASHENIEQLVRVHSAETRHLGEGVARHNRIGAGREGGRLMPLAD
ncbi:hypothetical protein B0H63DRAFT_484059 [Podospora didyma]|uniref:Secreted protein n=1 Tax=Podospora didyma TaxID=330526 RepID=A0AAE0KA16_9PEZI|nr:hypothetical protein B0H63DRAFT_484059 [Podospora didyma]